MAENSNSTLEMGNSDQALVAAKRKKTITFVIGGVAMLVTIAVVVTLVVLLSGNEGGEAEAIISTEGTTTPVFVPTEPTITTTTTTTTSSPPVTTESPSTDGTDSTTTPEPTTVEPPVTDPPPTNLIDLEDVINGAYAPASFNGTWMSGSEVLFRNLNGDLVLYDVVTDSTTQLVLNSSEILQQSSRVAQLSADGTNVILAYGVVPVYRYSFIARYSAIDIVTNDLVDIIPPGVAASQAFLQNFVWGPQGTSCAFVYYNNIYYKENLTATPQQVTTTGQLNVVYNGIPDWVYEEEVFVSSNAMWFSNDGSKLAYATFDDTDVRIMRVPHYVVPGSPDFQYTQHHDIRYPKPGTTNPTVSVTLRHIESGNVTQYAAPTDELDQPILKAVSFVTNESIALMWTNRVQNSIIVQLCTEDSTCTQIFTYTEQNGWIDNIPFMFNAPGNAFITILPLEVDGVLYKQIIQVSDVNANLWTAQGRTNTANTVAEILHWAPDNTIWYKATAVNDSAEQHIFRVTAAGAVDCFTCDLQRDDGGECLYNEATINSNGNFLTINCAGPGLPQIYIYDSNGNRLRNWDTNEEVSTMITGRDLPQIIRLSVPTAAGFPEADVQIQVPSDYANRTNVPLLVYVYGGPDTALVTKQWNIDWGTSLVSRWGVAVAHIDGRGSGLRGAQNMFSLNRRLGTVEIDDQINVTRYLHENLSWLDSNRTCIWGWSYGGYASSLALARGGDVFRCAVAVAPVVDWRFYDTIYTERYMDVPANNTQGYAESTLLSQDVVEAFRNKRYFLIHGTADDNVHYQHAMLISRLLQRQDVYFTQMSYTDEDHGLVGVRPHLYHAIEKFLRDNML